MNKNKTINAMIIGSLMAGTVAGIPSEVFAADVEVKLPSDLNEIPDQGRKDAVSYLYELGKMAGYEDGTFKPGKKVTRAEFVAMVLRAGNYEAKQAGAKYSDSVEKNWHYVAVDNAYKAGLLKGVYTHKDGSLQMNPNEEITRQEMLAILVRAHELQFGDVDMTEAEADKVLEKFTDKGDISGWAKVAVAKSIKAGITGGLTATTVGPKKVGDRLESAVFSYRLLKQVEAKLEEEKEEVLNDKVVYGTTKTAPLSEIKTAHAERTGIAVENMYFVKTKALDSTKLTGLGDKLLVEITTKVKENNVDKDVKTLYALNVVDDTGKSGADLTATKLEGKVLTISSEKTLNDLDDAFLAAQAVIGSHTFGLYEKADETKPYGGGVKLVVAGEDKVVAAEYTTFNFLDSVPVTVGASSLKVKDVKFEEEYRLYDGAGSPIVDGKGVGSYTIGLESEIEFKDLKAGSYKIVKVPFKADGTVDTTKLNNEIALETVHEIAKKMTVNYDGSNPVLSTNYEATLATPLSLTAVDADGTPGADAVDVKGAAGVFATAGATREVKAQVVYTYGTDKLRFDDVTVQLSGTNGVVVGVKTNSEFKVGQEVDFDVVITDVAVAGAEKTETAKIKIPVKVKKEVVNGTVTDTVVYKEKKVEEKTDVQETFTSFPTNADNVLYLENTTKKVSDAKAVTATRFGTTTGNVVFGKVLSDATAVGTDVDNEFVFVKSPVKNTVEKYTIVVDAALASETIDATNNVIKLQSAKSISEVGGIEDLFEAQAVSVLGAVELTAFKQVADTTVVDGDIDGYVLNGKVVSKTLDTVSFGTSLKVKTSATKVVVENLPFGKKVQLYKYNEGTGVYDKTGSVVTNEKTNGSHTFDVSATGSGYGTYKVVTVDENEATHLKNENAYEVKRHIAVEKTSVAGEGKFVSNNDGSLAVAGLATAGAGANIKSEKKTVGTIGTNDLEATFDLGTLKEEKLRVFDSVAVVAGTGANEFKLEVKGKATELNIVTDKDFEFTVKFEEVDANDKVVSTSVVTYVAKTVINGSNQLDLEVKVK